MKREINELEKVIRKQSHQLMDIEKIEACDIILTENGYEVVPSEMIGLRKLKIKIKDVRRWYGMLSKLRKKEYD